MCASQSGPSLCLLSPRFFLALGLASVIHVRRMPFNMVKAVLYIAPIAIVTFVASAAQVAEKPKSPRKTTDWWTSRWLSGHPLPSGGLMFGWGDHWVAPLEVASVKSDGKPGSS